MNNMSQLQAEISKYEQDISESRERANNLAKQHKYKKNKNKAKEKSEYIFISAFIFITVTLVFSMFFNSQYKIAHDATSTEKGLYYNGAFE